MRIGVVEVLLIEILSMLILRASSKFLTNRVGALAGPRALRTALMSSGIDSSVELESIVYRNMVDACKVTPETRLLLCVSGGVDSMALLHLMGAVKVKYLPELSVEVLNFNHNLRPEESQLEKETVEKWARHYEFPFHYLERGAEEAFGETGLQEAAREWRQETVKTLLEQYRKRDSKASMIAAIVGDQGGEEKKENVAVAATGHHMDDQLETMMLKITRGVHISRMYPMLPRSACGNFIKPLLSVSKEQLQQYMLDRDFSWHEDQSNADRKYKRNAVRLDLVPAMAEVAGGKEALYRRLAAMSEQSLQLRGWLEQEARTFILTHVTSTFDRGEDVCFPINAFKDLPSPVQLEIVHSIAQQSTGTTLDYDHLKKVVTLALEETKDGQASRAINLCSTWVATRLGDVVRIHDRSLWTEQEASMMRTKCLSGALDVAHPARVRVQAVRGREDISEGDSDKLCLCLSLDASNSNTSKTTQLVVRYPRPGDRLGSKRLSESFRGRRVPLHERDRVFVLAEGHPDCSGINGGGGGGGADDTGPGTGENVLGVFLPSVYGGSLAAPACSGGGEAQQVTFEVIM